ncbi:hypothetical protein Kpol_1028p42 [Vanderwaltozyma polyspora DSM 70294]|uniref:Mannosyltransferase n=1 Tax=Vanderwaltozyma polyspora (strain ATCC 22028 / DSM 70294 / BCRC 21397 / CBS 2163 / NBRC 10782 / NRRL Y-8283 / UCD 57-17) TaxID=436907 RepID=A7TG11_VANPO|nr:uncharacterized protein Kpol_1028p42 [Vanderwaltozyma polyspora DSM 70294]EDO18768.1 hypothetical protein Kpol_1028p42 [Vanderwaltozyma polyspora DSM 70294]
MSWSYIDSVVIVAISFYLIQAPYTKVEESFSIQAIHDILTYGIFDLSKYDHFKFPGAVQRSFVGPLIIAYLTKPFVFVSTIANGGTKPPTDFETQLLVRCIIGLTNAIALVYLKSCAEAMFRDKEEEDSKQRRTTVYISNSLGVWFIVFISTGFHLMYYSSRPLPNFILTLPLTNVVISWILLGNYKWAISLCAFVSVIFRSEVGAMGVGLALFSIIYRKVSLFNAAKFGSMGFFIGIGISLYVDSYFWKEWCVPEIDSFIFNVINGQASKWGTEPYFAYLTHYLRMLYLPPTILFLNLLGFKLAPDILKVIILSAYFHILALSIQPHKEWRFIIYAIPPITLSGSVAAAYLWENISITSIPKLIFMTLLPLSPVLSFFVSVMFLFVSKMNYPGGEALATFNSMIINNNITNVSVHLSVPACMTGVTLFGELDKSVYGVTYDKSETVQELEELWPSFDYLITTEKSPSMFVFNKTEEHWELVETTTMFGGIDLKFIINTFSREGLYLADLLKEWFINKDNSKNFSAFMANMIKYDDFLYTYKRVPLKDQNNKIES